MRGGHGERRMAIAQSVKLFVLALVGAALAGCAQHSVMERSASLGVSPQVSAAQMAPQRRASIAHHRRVAAVSIKHTPFGARPAATTDGSVGLASFYKFDSKTASGEQFN